MTALVERGVDVALAAESLLAGRPLSVWESRGDGPPELCDPRGSLVRRAGEFALHAEVIDGCEYDDPRATCAWDLCWGDNTLGEGEVRGLVNARLAAEAAAREFALQLLGATR